MNIYFAIESQNVKYVKELLEDGMDVSRVYFDTEILRLNSTEYFRYVKYKPPPLIFTAEIGNCEILKLMLDYGFDVDCTDYWNRTALLAVSEKGHFQAVKVLLEYGANPLHKDREGNTALMYASWRGHFEVVEMLCESGADECVNEKNNNGFTACMSALFRERFGIVDILEKYGAAKRRKLKGKK